MTSEKKYNKIKYETRLQLIRLICEQHFSYKSACKKLKLSVSTAKIIVKKYRENGKIFQKRQDKIVREHLQEFKAKVNQNKEQQQQIGLPINSFDPSCHLNSFVYVLPCGFFIPQPTSYPHFI